MTHGVALSVSDHRHLHHMLSNTNIELHSNTMSYISKNWITMHRTGTGAISISPPAPPSPSYALQYGELHLKTLSYISIHRATSQCIEHFKEPDNNAFVLEQATINLDSNATLATL